MQLLHLGSFSADFRLQIEIINRHQNKISTFTIPRATHPDFLPGKHNSSCFSTSVHNLPVFVQQSYDLNLVFTEDLARKMLQISYLDIATSAPLVPDEAFTLMLYLYALLCSNIQYLFI